MSFLIFDDVVVPLRGMMHLLVSLCTMALFLPEDQGGHAMPY